MKWQKGWQSWEPVPGIFLDVFCARGSRDGKTVVITAGVHGDEYEGPAAVMELARQLTKANLFGTVVAIPVLNPPAFIAGTRTNPEDGLNLARCFPGKVDGKPTERLAAALFEQLGTKTNYLIDLHSGGVEYVFLPLAGFYGPSEAGNPSYQSARCFGLPYLWQLPATPGVLSHEAHKRDAVAIGNEYLGAGKLSNAGVSAYCEGILRCLACWGLSATEFPPASGQKVLIGDWQLAARSGLFTAHVKLGEEVRAGTHVGSTLDMRGNVLEKFVAAHDGRVTALRSKAYIREGSWAVLVAESKNA
ncbi:MAG: succinylglutamate desuccinylase/aspartoacylase family protein [Acidobacteriaceae bacterium]|nr:succinylglutamate desuccinylase/aspartoacylase family protein [Acidobacteriaceae bacterium]